MKTDPVCKMQIDEDAALTVRHGETVYYFCSTGCRERFLETHPLAPHRSSYELIIIGGGPGGLTAAVVYASTMKLNAFVITRDLGGQALDSSKIENYMGYDFITGPELIDKFKDQLIHSHYVDHLMSKVAKIEPVEHGFMVTAAEPHSYFTTTLIIATDMTWRRLRVPGEEKFQRKGVFYGNIQDYSFVQGKDVAVIGVGNSALQITENLHTVARNIYLLSDDILTGDSAIVDRINHFNNLHLYENVEVLELTGQKELSGITIRKDGKKETLSLPVRGVFIAIGLQPNSSLVSQLVALNERREIIIGPDCATSYPGIFAAGDVTTAFGKRIIIASAEGAKAALASRQFILNLKKEEKHERKEGLRISNDAQRSV